MSDFWLLIMGALVFFIWILFVLEEVSCLERDQNDPLKHLIIVVKNQEKNIEGIMRKIMLFEHKFKPNTQLIIADVNSQDKTIEIIRKMAYLGDYFTIIKLKEDKEVEDLLDRYGRGNSFIIDARKKK